MSCDTSHQPSNHRGNKAAVQAMKKAAGPMDYARTIPTANASPKVSGLSLKQPTFNWKDTSKYYELVIWEMEV